MTLKSLTLDDLKRANRAVLCLCTR